MAEEINRFIHGKEDRAKLEALKSNPFMIPKFIKLQNNLCIPCKIKQRKLLSRGKTFGFGEMCEDCVKKAEKILK